MQLAKQSSCPNCLKIKKKTEKEREIERMRELNMQNEQLASPSSCTKTIKFFSTERPSSKI